MGELVRCAGCGQVIARDLGTGQYLLKRGGYLAVVREVVAITCPCGESWGRAEGQGTLPAAAGSGRV